MIVHEFKTELWLPRPPDDLFPFFSDAGNLEKITPPWLHFRILTPLPIEMQTGSIIDYRLRTRPAFDMAHPHQRLGAAASLRGRAAPGPLSTLDSRAHIRATRRGNPRPGHRALRRAFRFSGASVAREAGHRKNLSGSRRSAPRAVRNSSPMEARVLTSSLRITSTFAAT